MIIQSFVEKDLSTKIKMKSGYGAENPPECALRTNSTFNEESCLKMLLDIGAVNRKN